MRLYRNLVLAVAEALEQVFGQGLLADRVIEQALRSDKRWGARDRAYVAETTYEIVRWKRLIEAIAQQAGAPTDYAGLQGVYWARQGVELPPWEMFDGIDAQAVQAVDISQLPRAVRESVPDWLDAWGAQELGEEAWAQELEALNLSAEVIIRANALKCTPQELQSHLAEEGIETILLGQEMPQALQLVKRSNLFKTKAFHQGYFEVQDASSQMVAPMLAVAPGMRVVDACAGGGGKTLHLASLMQNQGHIVALDTSAWKLDELKKRAKRAGVHTIETRPIESSKTIKRLYDSADRLLLDVPCSGMGVLRRNPDAKWKLSPSQIAEIKQTQADILERYAPICKVGGYVLYATCSLMPSENDQQVAQFLAKHGDAYRLVAQQHLTPAQHGHDGFFMALLERTA